ncbi:outer membrane protein TOM13-domain-containing protein [Scheffersomyces amazonensis]|uniref:outer membrane protein TOM13-domain-containing protein n=1 Tax=Scheffersomyces amazonensis TaxID=1078765 RepID=UPI00315D4A0C
MSTISQEWTSSNSDSDFSSTTEGNSGLSASEQTILNDTEDEVIFEGEAKRDDEVEEVPADVDAITEENDLSVLRLQSSSDEIVNDEDVLNTEELINQSRKEEAEENQLVLSFNIWDILKKGAVNLILPFINGMMLGFGEILAHEIGFRYNWVGARVQPPRRIEQRNAQTQSKFL